MTPFHIPKPGVLRTVQWFIAALLLVQLARLFWIVVTPVGTFGQSTQATMPAMQMPLPVKDVFFGPLSASAPHADPSGWRVVGVRVSGHGGSAVFAPAQGPQISVGTGQELAPGLVLHAVQAYGVTLRTTDGLRTLALAEGTGTGSPAPWQGSAAPAAAPPAAIDPDPRQALSHAGLRARTENGRVAGYEVMANTSNEALLAKAGFRPGDVVLSINGQALDPERVGRLAEELRSRPDAAVTVLRDGQTQTLTLSQPSL